MQILFLTALCQLHFSITPDLLQHRDELSKFIGDEIARTMVEQKSLERRYEELIEQRAAMKGDFENH